MTALLPAYAGSLDPLGRRNMATHNTRRNADAARTADARRLGFCWHCDGPAAGWTMDDDGSPDTRRPLCETCDDESWMGAECGACGRSIMRNLCDFVEPLTPPLATHDEQWHAAGGPECPTC